MTGTDRQAAARYRRGGSRRLHGHHGPRPAVPRAARCARRVCSARLRLPTRQRRRTRRLPLPRGWQTAPYDGRRSPATDADGGPLTAEWLVNSTSSSGPGPGHVVTVSDDGANSFETRIVDEDDNDSGWRIETVRVDTNLPADTTDPGRPLAQHGHERHADRRRRDVGHRPHGVGARRGPDPERPRGHRRRHQQRRRPHAADAGGRRRRQHLAVADAHGPRRHRRPDRRHRRARPAGRPRRWP